MKIPVFIFGLLLSISAFSQVNDLKLVSDIYPPFTNVENEKAFASTIVREALLRSAIKSSSSIVEIDDLIAQIKAGKYDGSAALWSTDERREFLEYSLPYLQNQLVLVGKKGEDVSATSFAQLTGKRVAIVATYAYGDSVKNNSEVVFVKGKSDQENLERLLKEEADFMLVDQLLMKYITKYQEEDVAKYLEVGTTPLITRSLHLAVRKDHPQASYIIENFNEQVVKMMTDGSYNRILELNWIQTDIEGDGIIELIYGGNAIGNTAPTNSYSVRFQSFKVPQTSTNNRYYIEGKYYSNWSEVPSSIKNLQLQKENMRKVKIMDFRF